jgi:hypothetical protein
MKDKFCELGLRTIMRAAAVTSSIFWSGVAWSQGCTISTVGDLQALVAPSALSGNYCLANDIDASGTAFVPIGTLANPFYGTFDGNGFIIRGLTINSAGLGGVFAGVGLFGAIGPGGEVKNVVLTSVTVTDSGGDTVGGLAGANYGKISNSSGTGTISSSGFGSEVGGLVGFNFDSGSITHSYFNGSVSLTGSGGNAAVGALIGINAGNVAQSYSSGSVVGTVGSTIPDTMLVGGSVGIVLAQSIKHFLRRKLGPVHK